MEVTSLAEQSNVASSRKPPADDKKSKQAREKRDKSALRIRLDEEKRQKDEEKRQKEKERKIAADIKRKEEQRQALIKLKLAPI